MKQETRFLDGIRVYSPREGAPDFVKGAIVINAQELINAITVEGKDEIRLDIKESKAGKLYASIDDYQRKEKPSIPSEPSVFEAEEVITISGEEEMF